MTTQLPAPQAKESLSARLRVVLTFLKEMGSEEIKHLPGLRGFVAAVEKLSEQEAGKRAEEKTERLLKIGEQTQDDLGILQELSFFILQLQFQQTASLKALQLHLESAGLPTGQQELTDFAHEAALAAYRSRIARDYMYADYRGIEGITRSEHAVSFLLDDVYVLPRLRPDQRPTTSSENEQALLERLLNKSEELPVEERVRLEEQYAALTGNKWRVQRKSQEGGTPLAEVLKQTRQLVVIGVPGVGKTTLIRYLARQCALGKAVMESRVGWGGKLCPIVVSIAAFADAKSREPGLGLTEFLHKQMTECGGDALRAVVTAELAGGRAFVMLDGIDEVPNISDRSTVVQALERFIADNGNNRFLITSRPYGYIRIKGDLPQCQLANFSLEQVKTFVDQWEYAFECWQHSASPNFDRAKQEAAALIAEIQRNPKVEELATNPLMLVIIALIRFERTRLPEQRVQLYNRAVNTLMDTWNYWRSLAGVDVGGVKLPLDRLIRVWGGVAEWMRRTKPTGIVHRTELKRTLVEVLKLHEYDEEDPESTAESYLNAAANRTGLLDERGPGIFGFWHPTFEEFLAAVELATPTARAVERLLPLRDDPRWREVILLCVGYVGIVQKDGDTATEIVATILDKDPGPVEVLLRPYLRLAAACVADNVGVKRSLIERIIVHLADVIQRQPYEPFTNAFVQTVLSFPRLRPSRDTIRAIKPLTLLNVWAARVEAVQLASNVSSDDPEARAICVFASTGDSETIRGHAALGLLRAGDYRETNWLALSELASPTTGPGPAVSEFLANLTPDAGAALRSLLTAVDAGTRFRAAALLTSLGRADESVVNTLLSSLAAVDAGTRFQAAELLTWLGRTDGCVVNTLLSLLSTDDAETFNEAAELLISLGRADESLVNTLFALLSAEDAGTRFRAANWLTRLGRTDDSVVNALLSLLSSDNFRDRFQAARVLARFQPTDERLISSLFSWLSDKDSWVRIRTARLLTELGRANQAVINSLVSLVTANQPSLGASAARLLLELDCIDDTVINGVTSLLNADDPWVRFQAVHWLSIWGRTDERALETLNSLLNTDLTPNWNIKAAQLLSDLGLMNERALEAMARLVQPRPLVALGACGKVLQGLPLNVDDSKALADLVSVRPSDTTDQTSARKLLFNWLWQELESEAGQ